MMRELLSNGLHGTAWYFMYNIDDLVDCIHLHASA